VNINRAQQLHNTSPSEKRFSAILTSPVAVKYLLSSGGLRQMVDAAFLAPIEYCYLAFAVIIDFVIWALLLGRSTLIGVGLIAGSRLLISLRERIFRQAVQID
jgi:uncharacterized membrane protein